MRDGRFVLYFAGQVLGNTGAWFQNLALSLVVLGLTGSAQALSGVTIAQFVPILLFGVPAGALADRIRPRTILLCTSAAAAALAGAMAAVVASPEPHLWLLYGLIAVGGTASAFERVAAQTIVYELVGAGALSRAVSLSTIAVAAARSIGPGLAGIAFSAVGPVACMAANALAYLGAFALMLAIRPGRLHARTRHAPGRTAPLPLRRTPGFATLLIVNIVIALLSLNLMLVLTSTVSLTFSGGAEAVGAVHTLNAVGAIVGGVVAAIPRTVSVGALTWGCAALGVGLLAGALSPTLTALLWVSPLLGLGVGYYHSTLNAAAQSSVPPPQLGRAMSLMLLGNYGMAPLGAALMGWVIDAASGRTALAVGACAALAAAVFVRVRIGAAAGRVRDATPGAVDGSASDAIEGPSRGGRPDAVADGVSEPPPPAV